MFVWASWCRFAQYTEGAGHLIAHAVQLGQGHGGVQMGCVELTAAGSGSRGRADGLCGANLMGLQEAWGVGWLVC